jgi:SAM-dependent methyltransferase
MKQIRETSDFVCKKIIDKVRLFDYMRILEPSCGDGKILQYLYENYPTHDNQNFCIELNKERIENAQQNLSSIKSNFFSFQQADFLVWGHKYLQNEEGVKFNLILACPPFKNNVDLEHIKLMYELLSGNGVGQLVTLTSPYWITNNESHQVEFRKWLEDKNYSLEILPDNSFMEKDKSVPTAILTIKK